MGNPAPVTKDRQPEKTTNTAILVIHGMGEQNSYDTLDSFARGFAHYFHEQFKADEKSLDLQLSPRRIRHKDWTEVAIDLEFTPQATSRGLSKLTLFECYWAPLTKGKVTYRAVLLWLARTALTPLRHLSSNLQELLQEQEAIPKGQRKSAVFLFLRELWRAFAFYVPLLGLVAFLAWLIPGSASSLKEVWNISSSFLSASKPSQLYALTAILICLVMATVLLIFILKELRERAKRLGPSIERVAENLWASSASVLMVSLVVLAWIIARHWLEHAGTPLAKVLLGWRTLGLLILGAVALLLREILVKYLGDVALYVTADEKSASYETRAAILKRSMESLTRLLYESAKNYDQVILAGHSLGSVIAYDTINELLSQVWSNPDQTRRDPDPQLSRTDLAKLKGLVTFGSPLDKVYYFFREQVQSDQAVRAQILQFMHSFRRECANFEFEEDMKFKLGDSENVGQQAYSRPNLGQDFRWLNVWSRMDPVSGELRFYELKEKDRLHLWYKSWGLAHLDYWRDPRFYKFLAENLL